MVGLIQKILLDLVNTTAGSQTVVAIKKQAGVPEDKQFKINTAYSDAEWQRLWKATLTVLKITPEQAIKIYADAFYKDALNRFPMWFTMAKNSYEFLARQPAIHNSFATGARLQSERKAINDKFHIEKLENKLITHYSSPNKFCMLYIALTNRICQHYKNKAIIKEVKCMHSGDLECEIHIEWESLRDS